MKRSLVIIAALALGLSFAACNAKESGSTTAPATSATTTTTAVETTSAASSEATSESTSAPEDKADKKDAEYIKGIAGVWVEDTDLDARVMTIEEDGSVSIAFRGSGAMLGTVKVDHEGDKTVLVFDLGPENSMKVTSVDEPGKQEKIVFDSKDFLPFSREKQN